MVPYTGNAKGRTAQCDLAAAGLKRLDHHVGVLCGRKGIGRSKTAHSHGDTELIALTRARAPHAFCRRVWWSFGAVGARFPDQHLAVGARVPGRVERHEELLCHEFIGVDSVPIAPTVMVEIWRGQRRVHEQHRPLSLRGQAREIPVVASVLEYVVVGALESDVGRAIKDVAGVDGLAVWSEIRDLFDAIGVIVIDTWAEVELSRLLVVDRVEVGCGVCSDGDRGDDAVAIGVNRHELVTADIGAGRNGHGRFVKAAFVISGSGHKKISTREEVDLNGFSGVKRSGRIREHHIIFSLGM